MFLIRKLRVKSDQIEYLTTQTAGQGPLTHCVLERVDYKANWGAVAKTSILTYARNRTAILETIPVLYTG